MYTNRARNLVSSEYGVEKGKFAEVVTAARDDVTREG